MKCPSPRKMPTTTLKMAQHEPDLVPTRPKMAQRKPNMVPTFPNAGPTLHNMTQNETDTAHMEPQIVCNVAQKRPTLLFCKSKIGFCTRSMPSPPHPPLGQSYINSLRCSSAFRHQKLALHMLYAPHPPHNSLHCSSAFRHQKLPNLAPTLPKMAQHRPKWGRHSPHIL